MPNQDPPMPSQMEFGGELPTRDELLHQERTLNPILAEQLSLRPPADLENVPPTLAFNRVRQIAVPWPELMQAMSQIGESTMGATRALRNYFEESWWGEARPAPTDDDISALFDAGLIVTLPEDVAEGATPKHSFHYYTQKREPKPEKPPIFDVLRAMQYLVNKEGELDILVDDAKPLTEGVVMIDAISGRAYLIETEAPFTDLASLRTAEGYVRFWEEFAESAMVIGRDFDGAIEAQSHYQEVDLRAPYIERRYAELKVFEEVAKAIDEKVKGALDGLLELGLGRELDFSQFEAVQERYVNARLGPERIERMLRLLKKQALSMNYRLFLGDEPDKTLTFPDGTSHTAEAGHLYKTITRQCNWTVSYKKSIVRNAAEGFWYGVKRVFGGAEEKPTKTWTKPKSAPVRDYERVDTLTDPLAEKVRIFEEAGREVFVFDEAPGGYVTDDGQALTSIMARCRYDEQFRRSCVVMIPVYEQGFSIVKPVVSYHLFERPLPGIVATRLPQIFLSESLSYRTAWKGVELGELVSSINLTPGEEREMTITRSVTRETSESSSSTSVIELASSETTDIATEMERIARTENEFTANASSEVNTGSSEKSTGSRRNVIDSLTSLATTATTGTSSSSYKFGASDTLKTFSQSMNKVAKKAATSVSRSSKQEITTNSSETTTVSSSDTTIIKLANINKGRTLNLMFYRVYNRFAAGLYIDDLRFGVTEGTELIAGSGIYNTRVYSPGQIDALMGVLQDTPLPFDVSGDALLYAQDKLLDTLLETVDSEYVDPETEDEEGASAAILKAPLALLDKMKNARQAEAGGPLKAAAPEIPTEEAVNARIAALAKDFADIQLRSRALGQNPNGSQNDLLVAAQGLYLDSMLGTRPATEPYSEEMRAQEVRKSAAEVLQAEADADYTRAQAARISAFSYRDASRRSRNVLTGVLVSDDKRSLTLSVQFPLSAGEWVVCHDGDPVPGGELSEDQLHHTIIVVNPPHRPSARWPAWVNDPGLISRLSLRNLETEEEIEAL